MNIKTALTREFEKDLTERLIRDYAEEALKFKDCFKPSQHFISAQYCIYTPYSSLFTKAGAISSKSVDLDAHKVFQDTIFRFLGMDDKLIRISYSITPISKNEKWNYHVIYRLEPLCNLK